MAKISISPIPAGVTHDDCYLIVQGSLTEGEGSVRLTSLYQLVLDKLLSILKILFTFLQSKLS